MNDENTTPDPAAPPRLLGLPTETALLEAALRHGIPAAPGDLPPRTGECPFDSARKRMTTLHRADAFPALPPPMRAPCLAAVKGSPDAYLTRPRRSWVMSASKRRRATRSSP